DDQDAAHEIKCGVRSAECGMYGRPLPRARQRAPIHSALRAPHSALDLMRRVLIISHAYLSPANRGKLRALASRGVDVTVGVPQRWRDPVLGGTIEIAWERQN